MGVSNCFTCGKGFNYDVNQTLLHFKKVYEAKGIDRYFYKLSENDSIKVVKKQDFNRIFTEQIKPNFENGATYAHISEYSPKP